MSEINTIIFDFGGVLIDWNPRYLFRKIYDTEEEIDYFLEHICDMDWNEQQDAGRPLALATASKISEHPSHSEPIQAYYSRWQEMLGGPIESAVDILKELTDKNNVRLFGLTNWSNETFPIAKERYPFLNWFDGIVVSGKEKVRKPFPEIYKTLISRYNIDPKKAVFIDDNIRNLKGAEPFGIRCIHYESGEQLRTDLEKLDLL